jgi:hypothetical protein
MVVQLSSLPPEVLTHVAFQLALMPADPSAPFGPPSAVLPLLVVSHSLHDTLSPRTNNQLWADILHATWDTDAVVRRFGPDVFATSRFAAEELRRRWELLARVRDGGTDRGCARFASSEEARAQVGNDLLEIYLLLTENGACMRFL